MAARTSVRRWPAAGQRAGAALAALACLLLLPLAARAQQVQGDGIWLRDAYFGEAQTFDGCNGHQPASGMYHHHANPVCLRAQLDDNLEVTRTLRTGTVYREKATPSRHSPILGWAFDGYPIYGPYGYSDARNSQSGIRRMRSGYRLRGITARETLPEWALAIHTGVSRQLTTGQFGPPINAEFPLGRYQEDYEFAEGLGDLDVHNGRFAITPEFPEGTYAYFITVQEDGRPAFPYIVGAQYYGTVNGGTDRNIPSDAQDYFNGGVTTPPAPPSALLSSWLTRNSQQAARVASAFNPAADAQSTWPFAQTAGARTSGGVATPVNADPQRIRYNAASVYVNANGLASYVMGPWFDALQAGGIFSNWPSNANLQMRIPRAAAVAAQKQASGLGPVGLWVNGVAVFNTLDGASYSNARRADTGGGLVSPTAVHVSAASFERGPLAAGSLASAFPLFGAVIATETAAATSTTWPTSLGGTSVTIRDASGIEHAAPLSYVSPAQVNYRVPETAAAGFATVTVAAGTRITGNIHIDRVYPNLFYADATGLAAAQVVRVTSSQQAGAQQAIENVTQAAIDLGGANEQLFLVLYGTGLSRADSVTAAAGGVSAPVAFAGPQGTFPGLDQVNVQLPRSLAGRGKVEVVITAAGRRSNSVHVTIR